MDIFVKNVPAQCNDNQLREFFKRPLAAIGIQTFGCTKPKGKSFGFITIPTVTAATKFLELHGASSAFVRARQPLKFHGSLLHCAPGTKQPDKIVLECLAKEDADRKRKVAIKGQTTAATGPQRFSFDVATLHSGFWDYRQGSLTFYQSYADNHLGSIIFGRKSLVVILDANSRESKKFRIDISYETIQSILMGNYQSPTITLNLEQAPIFYALELDIEETMENLNLGVPASSAQPQTKKSRVCNLGVQHSASAGSCLVYRLRLSNPADLTQISNFLKKTHGTPSHFSFTTTMRQVIKDYTEEMGKLENKLQTATSIPWSIRFQLQRLATNGLLPPDKVSKLLSHIVTIIYSREESSIVEGIRRLFRSLPYPGPDQDESTFKTATLLETIKQYADEFAYHGSVYETAERHSQLALVHRVTITPAGNYLEGPELETKNRVLRKYPQHTDYFIRVHFTDENGEALRNDPTTSRWDIFHNRFNRVLDSSINIAGRRYTFLGFSHSSLRASQCWFMAPFVEDGGFVHAKEVISGLGNFSSIRSPAKCAARIGQAFSDTTDAIMLDPDTSVEIPDVTRNGRNFTDGVGTISADLLARVWKEFRKTRREGATLLQVRFRGAKGMLALNTKLPRNVLVLRHSMVKFESKDNNLEICGAAFKPLPCFLNRQFIKIFEDLGVSDEAFLDLQQKAVARLELLTRSPVNAANFLETHRIATAARVPSLIRLLADIGLDFKSDQFLRQIVEIAASIQLRDIKHRGRISVEKGYTLYGIADETNFLRENQVHVIVRQRNGSKEVLLGPMIVTRAPALHPGDIRVVEAVGVPPGSTNEYLHNCIIFSQQGERDLPSQLSGGDLDGDLYNVILDRTLWPKRISDPADYPRLPAIDIGRNVTPADITNFFLTFMETDQLGFISNSHMQAADQMADGTFSEPCIVLAGMASTAVDYSKTGIPVDMTRFPKGQKGIVWKAKPDFMAWAPRLIVSADKIEVEHVDPLEHEEFDAVHALDPERRRPLFYTSQRILGKLYRAIDETKFLNDMHDRLTEPSNLGGSNNLLDGLWAYVVRNVKYIQWRYLSTAAEEIRESYEYSLIDIMHQHSPHQREPLSELEVFAGTILGRVGGLSNKHTRDLAIAMKEAFERNVTFHINWIQHGEIADEDGSVLDYGGQSESLERSIACLALAMEKEGKYSRGIGNVKSFAYVAAAVCLKEVRDLGSTVSTRR